VLSENGPALKTPSDDLETTLLACLPRTGVARPTRDLREQIGRRKAFVLDALRRLQEQGLVEHTRDGWRRTEGPTPADPTSRFPVPPLKDGNPGTSEVPSDSPPAPPSDQLPGTPAPST